MAGNPGLPVNYPSTMPNRQVSMNSTMSEEVVPTGDPRDTTELLAERLQAWKHAVAYLEDYISVTEKIERAHAKEYEKVLKTIQNPLKEGRHFDQSVGGIAGLFENMRQNTQELVNSHLETERNIKGSVLPILDRLHKEIKSKAKELTSGASKSAKEVEKARNTTQKYIELLGQNTASFEAAGGKLSSSEDPYVLRRGVLHRLARQVIEENNNRHDLIAVQSNFAYFEQHIIEVIQTALASFNQFVSGQAQKQEHLYSDILGTAQAIPLNFEWEGFLARYKNLLVDPSAPDRSVEAISFPNQDHNSTKPLIEGTLERKSRNKLNFGKYSTGYYVVTPCKYLHEFKDDDNLRKEPTPEISIYLPDATVSAPSGENFNVRGKDVSKGLSSKFSGTSEIHFKAPTPADAEKWFDIIRTVTGVAPSEPYQSEPSTPTSPIEKMTASTPLIAAPSSSSTAEKLIEEKPTGEKLTGEKPILENSSEEKLIEEKLIKEKAISFKTTGITGDEIVSSPTAISTPSTSNPTEK